MENAVCKFCGQSFMVKGKNDEERMRAAIRECDCSQAVALSKKWDYIEDAKHELGEVFRFNPFTDKEDIYGEDETAESIKRSLEGFIEHLADFNIRTVSVNALHYGKITMAVDGEGKIKIKKLVSSSYESKV